MDKMMFKMCLQLASLLVLSLMLSLTDSQSEIRQRSQTTEDLCRWRDAETNYGPAFAIGNRIYLGLFSEGTDDYQQMAFPLNVDTNQSEPYKTYTQLFGSWNPKNTLRVVIHFRPPVPPVPCGTQCPSLADLVIVIVEDKSVSDPSKQWKVWPFRYIPANDELEPIDDKVGRLPWGLKTFNNGFLDDLWDSMLIPRDGNRSKPISGIYDPFNSRLIFGVYSEDRTKYFYKPLASNGTFSSGPLVEMSGPEDFVTGEHIANGVLIDSQRRIFGFIRRDEETFAFTKLELINDEFRIDRNFQLFPWIPHRKFFFCQDLSSTTPPFVDQTGETTSESTLVTDTTSSVANASITSLPDVITATESTATEATIRTEETAETNAESSPDVITGPSNVPTSDTITDPPIGVSQETTVSFGTTLRTESTAIEATIQTEETAVKKDTTLATKAPQTATKKPTQSPTSESKRYDFLIWLIIGLAVIIVAIIVVILCIAFSDNGEANKTTNEDSSGGVMKADPEEGRPETSKPLASASVGSEAQPKTEPDSDSDTKSESLRVNSVRSTLE